MEDSMSSLAFQHPISTDRGRVPYSRCTTTQVVAAGERESCSSSTLKVLLHLLISLALGVFLLLPSLARSESSYASKCAAFIYLSYSGAVAGDAPNTTSHKTVNCYLWQQFIALNWPAVGDRFGQPGDRGPVQWQTFPSLADVFRPSGVPPAADRHVSLPASCAARVKAAGLAGPEELTVLQTPPGPESKRPRINYTEQAGAPNHQPSWIGASNDTNLWYEIRVNREIVEFIAANRLYRTDGQAAFVASGHPLVLPKGSLEGRSGAIVVKAAWMEAPDPENPKWGYFKTSDAAVLDAEGTDCRLTRVALVGLHIIQKTTSQPSYFWATFEHVDNVPDENGPVSGSFNLHNDRCQPREVIVSDRRCLAEPDGGPMPRSVTIGCKPNTRPPYHIGGNCPPPRAIQTVRTIPIQADVDNANRVVQASIAKTHANSIWRYYKLINVQWSPSPLQDPEVPQAVPARFGPTIPALPVANTTMETYLQTTTCTTCHVNGALASHPAVSADFSFIFQAAAGTRP